MRNRDDTGFPKLSAPARRALSGAGYTHLGQLVQVSEGDLKKLHGMGPTAMAAPRAALDERRSLVPQVTLFVIELERSIGTYL